MAEPLWVGRGLRRKEDPTLLTGRGRFVGDVALPGMLHAAILPSPHAHARIASIDAREALGRPGVVAVLTGEDAARRTLPFNSSVGVPTTTFCLAVGKVRYAGEPVAAVVARDRYIAEDARDLIHVEYKPLAAAVEPEAALAPGAPLLYEEAGTNLLWQRSFVYGDPEAAFRQAEHFVGERFYSHRYSSTPVETCGAVADYSPAQGTLTFWDNNHLPMVSSAFIALALKLRPDRVRFIQGNIGGSYGSKAQMYFYEVLLGLLAMAVGGPVGWRADRREELLAAACHGPGLAMAVELALRRDGTILGLRLKTLHDCGSFIGYPEPLNSARALRHCTGCYRIRNLSLDITAVVTNKRPTGTTRGVGAYQFYFALERSMDIAARELGLDPAEIRFRNFIQPPEMPYTTPNGNVYDSGDYPEALQQVLEMLNYRDFRQEQARRRREGRYLGLGLATVVESSTPNVSINRDLAPPAQRALRPLVFAAEAASLRLEATGKAVLALGSVPQGQGHETVAAQIVADELGLHPEDVTVLTGFDSAAHPYTASSGTYGNRFATTTVGAILGAARKVRERLLAVVGHLLGARPEELEMAGGAVYLRQSPEKAMPIDKIAFLAHNRSFPPAVDACLEATHIYQVPFFAEPDPEYQSIRSDATYGNSAHGALVEVDPQTGEVRLQRYVVVHDCGRMLNPLIVEGQIQGGISHGLGSALYEEHVYDDKGQLLTGSFNDYLPPYASEVPEIEVGHLESPSPLSPLGEKGLGEGTGVATAAVIANALEDALAPWGLKVNRLPLTPCRVWELIQGAKASQGAKAKETSGPGPQA